MVFRIVYRIIYGFIANERVIQRLSESYPMRRAAQLVSSVIIRGRRAIEDNVNQINKQEFIDASKVKTTHGNPLTRFSQRLINEFKDELNKAKEEFRRRQG